MPINFTYSDYESQASDAARLERLRLHISEVEDMMDADTSGADMSVSRASLEAKLRRLQERRAELERKVARASMTGVTVARTPRQY